MTLTITLTFAAAAALINLWLGARVVQLRARGRHMVGDGGDPALLARMRAHANFVEYTPFALILVALIELAQGPGWWLWAASALFVVARVLHPFGMDRPAPNPLRMAGVALTLLVLLGLAGWAAAIAWQGGGIGRVETVEAAPIRG